MNEHLAHEERVGRQALQQMARLRPSQDRQRALRHQPGQQTRP